MIDYHKDNCTFRKRDRLEEFFVENSLVESLHKVVVNSLQELGKDESKKARLASVLYNLLEAIRVISTLLSPFMPTTTGNTVSCHP